MADTPTKPAPVSTEPISALVAPAIAELKRQAALSRSISALSEHFDKLAEIDNLTREAKARLDAMNNTVAKAEEDHNTKMAAKIAEANKTAAQIIADAETKAAAIHASANTAMDAARKLTADLNAKLNPGSN